MKLEITVYTRTGCVHCKRMKEWMRDNRLSYREVEISSPADRAYQHIKGVPYTVIRKDDHEEVVMGFNPNTLSELLL